MLTVRTIRSLEELQTFQPVWNDLLGRSQTVTIFLTWEWIATWFEVYVQPGQLYVLLVLDPDGRPVGIAPLWMHHVRKFGSVRRELRLAGSTVAADHLDFIIDKDFTAPALQAIWQELFGPLCRDWDILRLENASSNSQLLRTFYKLADQEHRCVRREVENISVCPYIKFPQTFDALLGRLGSKTRYGINKARKALDSQGAVEYRVCRSEQELDESMAWLVETHQKSWASRGKPGAFARTKFLEFHRKVSRELLRNGWLNLYSIWLDGRHIASSYGFEFSGVAMGYLAGVDIEYDRRLSIGKVLLSKCIEHAITGGCREFDLLRGDEAYKYHWTDRERHNFTLVLYNGTVRTFTFLFLGFMRDLGKGMVRQFVPAGEKPGTEHHDKPASLTMSEERKTTTKELVR